MHLTTCVRALHEQREILGLHCTFADPLLSAYKNVAADPALQRRLTDQCQPSMLVPIPAAACHQVVVRVGHHRFASHAPLLRTCLCYHTCKRAAQHVDGTYACRRYCSFMCMAQHACTPACSCRLRRRAQEPACVCTCLCMPRHSMTARMAGRVCGAHKSWP